MKRITNIPCEVKHSESKSAWNVVGTVAGTKYKLARIPYVTDPRMTDELNENERKEALMIARFIAKCLQSASYINNLPLDYYPDSEPKFPNDEIKLGDTK